MKAFQGFTVQCSPLNVFKISIVLGKDDFQFGGQLKCLFPRAYLKGPMSLASGQSDQLRFSKATAPSISWVGSSGLPRPFFTRLLNNTRMRSANALG